MKTILTVDTSELTRTLAQMNEALGTEKTNIALRHTIQDVGRRARTLTKRAIREKYRIKAGRIDKAIRAPQYTLNGTVSCVIPIQDARGTIAKSVGAFDALSEGAPGAKVIHGAVSILPHDKHGKRIHFYIPSGRLQGHIFTRHDDNVRWVGKRRVGTGKTEQWQTKTGKKRKNKQTVVTGVRKRKGTISHGVGIGIPQMAMNRAGEDIQENIADLAMKRLLHYQEQILKGNIKR